MSDLRSSFRFHLAHFAARPGSRVMAAVAALGAARIDLLNNVDRYPLASGWNPPVTGAKARWIENPAACGLRLVGAAHDIVQLKHTGWYTGPDQDESIFGVVYQMPSRNGRPVYVAGHNDANNDGAAYLDFGAIFWGEKGGYQFDADSDTACRDAARYADQFAEREAEEERDYQTAWQAGSRYQQCLDDYRETRKTMLAGMKHNRTAPLDVRRKWCQSAAELRTECFAEMSELQDGKREGLIFYPDARLRAAFNEGRG